MFKNKLALVTGSSKGIGLAVVKKILEEGGNVILNGRSNLDELAESLRREFSGREVIPAACDLGTAKGCEECIALLRKLEEGGRPLDVLVNNLGIYEAKKFEEITDGEWMTFFEVNVLSGVRLCRYLLPRMIARGAGSIVFVSSEAGVAVKPFMAHYSLTKTAQLSLARSLAEMTQGHPGVRVNSVLPGPTRTEGVVEYIQKMGMAEGEYVRSVEPNSLLMRLIEPEEVANTVCFVASNQHAINGAAIRSEGGIIKSI